MAEGTWIPRWMSTHRAGQVSRSCVVHCVALPLPYPPHPCPSQVVDVNDADFWRTLFTSPFSFDELTNSVPLTVVRNLKEQQPVSLVTP